MLANARQDLAALLALGGLGFVMPAFLVAPLAGALQWTT
jgi:hypothetical protein